MRRVRTSHGIASILVGVLVVAGAWPTRAAAQENATVSPERGTIAGKVLDNSTGEPIIEAGVEVVQTHRRVRTDLDGKYKMTLPPGTYELRIFAPLYTGTRLQKVVVRADAVTTANAALKPEGEAGVEVVEVVAQAEKSAEAIQLLERKMSPVVSDNIGAETIKKSTDSDAAEIVERVPAVTVEKGGFIVVRGLGDRYSGALLNGSRLPSTDPDKRVVPLDLFPSDFVEALSIKKTYTPDLPGDYSGGLVDIQLKEVPDRLSYTIGVQSGGNTASTFQSFNTYNGGTLDYFTFGSKFRQLPDRIPNFNITAPPIARQRFYAATLKNVWTPHNVTAPPNFGLNFNIGNTWGPLGASLGGLYTTEYKEHRVEIDRTLRNSGSFENPTVTTGDDFTYNRATFESRLGGVFTAGYSPSPLHKISFRSLVNRQADDETLSGSGTAYNTGAGNLIDQTRLQYSEQQLGFGQLSSEHHVGIVDISTRTALSETTKAVPDSRILQYNFETPPPVFFPDAQSGLRTWLDLEEHLSDSAVDFSVPVRTGLPFTDVWSGLPAKFQFGPAYTYRKRSLEFRRFRWLANSRLFSEEFRSIASLPGEQLLTVDHIGAPGQGFFQFIEDTRVSDSFSASQEIAAAYAMVDLPIVEDTLRLVGGVRTEYSYIALDSQANVNEPIHARINDLDPLPGVNLIYSPRDDMNVRYAYSITVSRPEFRELTPTIFPNPGGLSENIIGNPDLVSASTQSHDLRWEWFLSPNELASVSFFYKELSNPIEKISIPQSSGEAAGFQNASDGQLIGFEVEGRKEFSFLSPKLAGLSLAANVAYIDSSVNIVRQELFNTTNTHRALVDQSPYVFNAALEYANPSYGTTRLLYNTRGRRIIRAGADGLDDVYEESRNELDFIYLKTIAPFDTPINAKLGIENITDDRTLQTQNGVVRVRYTEGVKFTFGLSYTF